MSDHNFDTGRAFLEREGRLLERRLFAVVFDGAAPGGAIDVLRGYQNPDGGFGHGLEPDKRCPDSLPLDVEAAFGAMVVAGEADATMVRRACDWLASVATPDGAVPLSFPVMEPYPRAEHMSEWTYEPGFNPTAGLVGLLHRMGIDHPWREQAEAWCWATLDESGFPDEVHAMSEVMVFLVHVPDRARADAFAAQVGDWLPKLNMYRADPDDPGYGVSPLHFAPTPQSRWRALFSDAQIDGHLDRLAADQQPDGGFTIAWEPPGAAATLEWRGIQTLWALRTLAAYRGRT
ncbi:MAG: hypothetical protein ACRDZ3_08710 [Acidimicrobiia bacterium]